jgi:hypothetical protein
MNKRVFQLALSGLVVLVPAACRERGRPDPAVRMAVSHEPEQVPAGETGSSGQGPSMEGGQGQVAVPTRLEVPEAVKQAYSGIVLLWKDASTGKEGKLDVPLDGSAEIPDSGLTVAGDVFLPAFTMTADVITSSGVAEENPAARIRVSEKGAEIFSGWIFQRFPDVHPFTHSRFSLHLEGGIQKPKK